MKKNQNTFKIRVNEKSLLENLTYFKDYLISSNILKADFSNLNIFYFEYDNFIEEIQKQNLFPSQNFIHISKENFQNNIKNYNKTIKTSEINLSLVMLPQKITENAETLKSYQKKIIQKIKSNYNFIVVNVPENKFTKRLQSWSKNIIEGKFYLSSSTSKLFTK